MALRRKTQLPPVLASVKPPSHGNAIAPTVAAPFEPQASQVSGHADNEAAIANAVLPDVVQDDQAKIPPVQTGGGLFFMIMDDDEIEDAPGAESPPVETADSATSSSIKELAVDPLPTPKAPVSEPEAVKETARPIEQPVVSPVIELSKKSVGSTPESSAPAPIEPVVVITNPAPSVAREEGVRPAVREKTDKAAPVIEPKAAVKGAQRSMPARRRAVIHDAATTSEPENEEDTIVDGETRILSITGGEFELQPEMQSLVCYLSDGRLLVSKSHRMDPRVRAYVGRLNLLKRTFRVLHVDLSVIETAYQSASANQVEEKKFTDSDMQNAAYSLFRRAAINRASDIHIRASKTEATQIYFRIIGDMEMIEEHTYDYGHALISTIYQAMTDQSDATFTPHTPQDARVAGNDKLPGSLSGIRVATLPQVNGNVMILRLLYKDTRQTSDLSELGFSPEQVEAFVRLRRRTTGIIFNSGPTGAGKSTTLQRALTGVIQETAGRKNIITVEDPPEYPIHGATQVPVTNAATEEERAKAFQTTIRAALRSDPDIMMIGEVRDGPAAKLAITGAMTGHPIWTTIHANSAFDIFDRLIDMSLSVNKLASHTVISGLIAQRLVKLICPHCRVPFMSEEAKKARLDEEIERMKSHFERMEDKLFLRGPGCEHCENGQPGYIGRTVIAELIETDEGFMRFIREDDREGAKKYWLDNGGKTLEMHARDKVLQGLIDPFDAEEEVQWT